MKNRLESQLLAYGALAAAGAVGGISQNADAAIVYSGVVNINIPSTTSGVYLNVVTGVSATSPAGAPGWDVNPWSSSGLSYFNPAAPTGGVYVQRVGGGATGNLPLGTMISATPDGGRLYGSGAAATTGNDPHILSSSNNLIGFRFQNEANANAVHYGWMRISLDASLAGQPRTIVEYAYENQAGVGIPAGFIPAPGSAALLALGALGLAGRRRKA
jgi:hypothetical protein